ncbi:MAG: tRNA pseudouridine(55) synthase, partial [Bacteroidia bacterium]
KAARKGKEIKLRERFVSVYEFELIDQGLEAPLFAARIRCSKGTYIRSLAHDLGQALGVGAYITELKRTRIGEHKLEDAWRLEEFVDKVNSERHKSD